MSALLICMILTLSFLILIVLYTMISGVVPMPSSRIERETVLQILNEYSENTRFDECLTVVDLGSGWGGLAKEISRTLPARKVEALELSLIPYLWSRYFSFISGQRHISNKRINFLKRKLESQEIYVCYLSGAVMKKLRSRFETDRPRGGVLISIAFAMPDWTPVRVEYAGLKEYCPVYVYEF